MKVQTIQKNGQADIVQENDAPIEELQNRIKELKEGKSEKIKADQTEEERLQRRHDEEKRLETIRLSSKKHLNKTVANNLDKIQ